MTYKHLKFTESSTMQAFEKMAKDKGLIKADPTKKVASKSLDLIPSDNLLENILKLTSGLRAQGFNKYAGELEKKFLSFKEAQSLYETSKETGEDLVDQAHPKGSHDLEGVEGDATVETIVDQKKKIEEIVNKKPTGKFANNQEIIDAVKIALAETTSFKFVKEYLIPELNEALSLIQKNNDERAVNVLSSIKVAIEFANRLTEQTLAAEIDKTESSLNKVKEELDVYYENVKSDWNILSPVAGPMKNSNVGAAVIKIDSALTTVNRIKRALKMESTFAERGAKPAKFLREVDAELNKVRKLEMLLNTLTDENDKKVGKQWIEYFNKNLNEIKNNSNLQNTEIADRIVDKLTPQLVKLRTQITDFDSKL